MFFCCTGTQVLAATQEKVIAVLPNGVVQLQNTGKAAFANLRFPDAKLAEAWFADNLLQHDIHFEKGETDRYGRSLITSELEVKMLQDGIALIYATNGDIAANWAAAEAFARNKKMGIWADKNFIVTPQNAAEHENEFHIVEGTITRIYEGKTATYLNFGEDWQSDFSITIPAKLRRSMKDSLAALKEGSHVRVRGHIYEENGPMVMLNHADNLEKF